MDRNWSIYPPMMAKAAEEHRRLVASFKLPTPAPLPPPDPRFKHGPSELCQLAVQRDLVQLGPDWVMEEKHDGVRLLWKAGQLLTREGEPAPFAEHLREEFERLERRCGKRMFFDCEYVEPGGFHATLAAVRRGEGTGIAHVFACLTIGQWLANSGAIDLVQRHFLEAAFGNWKPDGLRLVERSPALNPNAVELKARLVWANGGEGLMLKNRQAPYVRGRTSAWVKVKRKLRLEATVTAATEGSGAVTVELANGRHRVPCQRKLRVGDRVTVEAMEWTDKGRLRQPRIVGDG